MAYVPGFAAPGQHPTEMPLGERKEPVVQVATIPAPSANANANGVNMNGAAPGVTQHGVFYNNGGSAQFQQIGQQMPSYQPSYQPIPPQGYQPTYDPSNPATYQANQQTGYQPTYQPAYHAPYQPGFEASYQPSSQQPPYQPGNHAPYQPTIQQPYQAGASYQPGNQLQYQPASHPACQPAYQAGNQSMPQQGTQSAGQAVAQSNNQPTYQERAAQAIQGAWRMSRKRMAKGKDNPSAVAPAQTVQSTISAPTSESASNISSTGKIGLQEKPATEAETSNVVQSMVQSPLQSPGSEEPPPYPESVVATEAGAAKKPSMADKTKATMSQFKHLDEAEYVKEIALLSPEELTQLHGKISRKLVSASMGAAHGTVCAPFTAGISLASTGINGRRVNVNYRRKKLIEARLMEIQAEKYKLRKRDYAIPAAILGASFGIAGGAEGLFVEHLGTETAVHAATVATENAADHTSHKIHEHRYAKKFGKSKVSVVEQSDSTTTVASSTVIVYDETSIPPPAPYQPVPHIVGSSDAAPDYFSAPIAPHQTGEILVPVTSPLSASAIDIETATEPATSPPPILSPVQYFPPPPPGLPGRSATAIGIVPTLGSPSQSLVTTPSVVVAPAGVPAVQIPHGPFNLPAALSGLEHDSADTFLSAEAEKLKLSQLANSEVETAAINAPIGRSEDASNEKKQDQWSDEKASFVPYQEEHPMPVPDGFQRPSSPGSEKRPLLPPAPDSGTLNQKPMTKYEEASSMPYYPPPSGVTVAAKPPPTMYQSPTGSQAPYFAPPPSYQDAVANSSRRPSASFPPIETKVGHQMSAPGAALSPHATYIPWSAAPNAYPGTYQMPPNQGSYGYAPPPQGQYGQPPPPNAGPYGQFNATPNGPPPQSSAGYYDVKASQQPYMIPTYNPATYNPGANTQ